jgi:hypothetical protein
VLTASQTFVANIDRVIAHVLENALQRISLNTSAAVVPTTTTTTTNGVGAATVALLRRVRHATRQHQLGCRSEA